MSYEPDRMLASSQTQTHALLSRIDPERFLLGLYFDCAGRSSAFSGLDQDESKPVREQVGGRRPFMGFYSGVEIAPFMGRSRPLDWTGVLILFSTRH